MSITESELENIQKTMDNVNLNIAEIGKGLAQLNNTLKIHADNIEEQNKILHSINVAIVDGINAGLRLSNSNIDNKSTKGNKL